MKSSLLYTQITLLVFLLSLTLFPRATRASSRADVSVTGPLTELSLHLTADELYDDGDVSSGVVGRRSLFWQRMRYYISYGALSANRVPCPPRSGRSYYTHDCWRARGPVHPYTRGCSAITRCRR